MTEEKIKKEELKKTIPTTGEAKCCGDGCESCVIDSPDGASNDALMDLIMHDVD